MQDRGGDDGHVIDVQLLGPVGARRGDTAIALGGRRQRALLALLLTAPERVITTDRLIEELWAGEPPDGAEVTLRSYVSRLRAALGDEVAITNSAAGYAIAADRIRVDARGFEELIRSGEAALQRGLARRASQLLREALAMWVGPPFGNVADDGALRAESERLERLRLRALEARIDADLALGRSGELVDELEALLREHPYREPLWRQLMLALYRADRQADALVAYQRARQILDEQLGLEPGEELERLQLAILRHEVPVPIVPEERHNLPAPLTSFVGRGEELEHLTRLLAGARLLTLAGVGGVGKTRLALELARRALPDHPDGVYFVDLSSLTRADDVAAQLAAVLEVRELPDRSLVDVLGARVRDLDLLLVVDNCEHVRAGVARTVSSLLERAPRLRVVATSREVLGVPGEMVYAVPRLGLADGLDDLAGARASEAVRLFFERAREARPDLQDDDAVVATVARICSELDGLPLGIELAAARARALAPSEIAARLHDRYRFLVSWRRLSPARHRTLREAMDWSYELLDAAEQRVLRELSVFAGGCTLDAAAAVTTDGDEDVALAILERLVEASLISADTSVEPTRYRLLETVRQYGASVLDEASETAAVLQRHAEHFTDYASRIARPLRSEGVQAFWIARVAPDRDNFRAAVAWAREHENWEALLTIAESLWWLLWIRGEVREARQWLLLGIEHGAGVDPELRARAELGAANLAWAQGDHEAAEDYGERARAGFARLGLPRFEGDALNTLGLAAQDRGQLERARDLFEAAIAKYPLGDEPERAARNIAVSTDNLASVAHMLKDLDRSRELYAKAMAMNQALGNLEGVSMNTLHLGMLDAEQGRWDEARVRIERALRDYRALGFLQYAAECLEWTAAIANGTGSASTAAFALGAASSMREGAGIPPPAFIVPLLERELAAARAAIGDAAVDAALAEGRAAGMAAGIERALEYLAG